MKRRILIGYFLGLMMLSVAALAQQRNRPRPAKRPPQANQMDILYLDENQEAETLAYIKKTYPDRLDRLQQIKTRRPNIYRQWLSKAYREMSYLSDLKGKDEEQYQRILKEKQLEQQSKTLAQSYKNASGADEKERIRQEVQALLTEIFDLRQENRQSEIARLEKRLAEAKEKNRLRLENKNTMIEDRLNQILGDDEDLKW